MLVVFYTVNLFTCVFMTCYTCIRDTLVDPWYGCMYRELHMQHRCPYYRVDTLNDFR